MDAMAGRRELYHGTRIGDHRLLDGERVVVMPTPPRLLNGGEVNVMRPTGSVSSVAMTRLATVLPYEPPHLRELIEETTYKPGWEFHLELFTGDAPDQRGAYAHAWRMIVVSDTLESLKRESNIQVGHPFLVPPASYKRDVWAAWIRDRIAQVEGNHELGEFLAFGGVREFAPHHAKGEDPYIVWHVSDYAEARKNQRDD